MTKADINIRIDSLDRKFRRLDAARTKAVADGKYDEIQWIDAEQDKVKEKVERLRGMLDKKELA